jgi:hypothetical protein
MSGQGEMRLEEQRRELPPLEFDLSGWHAVADVIRKQTRSAEPAAEAKPE